MAKNIINTSIIPGRASLWNLDQFDMPEIKDIFQRATTIVQEYKLDNLQALAQACRRQFALKNTVEVAVLGRFKAGKSSFLNHLIGRDVLPIAAIPLTGVITKVKYGSPERAVVHFLNNRSEQIPVENARLYISENENPKNEKNVDYVEIELPELKQFEPLEFIDTPGLESVFSHNTRAALQWLPNTSAAVLAVSCDAPLSDSDIALLAELAKFTPRITLLLTKADILESHQMQEVKTFVKNQIKQNFKKELEVFFYSTKPEFSYLKERLNNEFLNPLIKSSGSTSLEVARHKVISLINSTIDYLNIALAAESQTEQARSALRKSLATEKEVLKTFREELLVLTNEWSARALDFYLEKLRPQQESLQKELNVLLKNQFKEGQFPLVMFVKAYARWLNKFLTERLIELSRKNRGLFCEPLYKTQNYLERAIRAFRERLAQNIYDSLGIKMEIVEFRLEIVEPEEPPVDISTEFIFPIEILGHIIPMKVFGALVERNLMRRARYEVEKNISRLSAEWRDRVSNGMRQLTNQAVQFVENELRALEQMLDNTISQKEELTQKISELQLYLKLLKNEGATVEK